MIIVMYAGGIPFNGATIQERSLGGSESACYYVARELARRGHEVTVFTESPEEGVFDEVRYCYAGEKTIAAPLGVNWQFFCENTPHDVNIVQRHPLAYHHPIQSKINLWWAHDICLRRNDGHFMAGLWQVNAVLTVSEWFKRQMTSVWTVNPEIVHPIHNGVEYSLFDRVRPRKFDEDELVMVYCSRPERGLENLVGEGGIMEQLREKRPNARLYVCGYEHAVPEMEPFYRHLRARIDELPNCDHLGALSKSQLYSLLLGADIWIYPTQFEEVSCITAMECMGAGLHLLTTDAGALPETIGDYQNSTMFSQSSGEVPIGKFVDAVVRYRRRSKTPRREYTWQRATDEIEAVIEKEFLRCTKNKDALARHFLRNSDIVCLRELVKRHGDEISREVTRELAYYLFDRSPQAFVEHYERGAVEQCADESWSYEENFDKHPRFRAVAEQVAELEPGSKVIDYGCGHGHFTNYLARMFPSIQFVGLDVSSKLIEVATAKAKEWSLSNVLFYRENWLEDNTPWDCDLLILGEILEHVPDPRGFLDIVRDICAPCAVVMTTPFGPWEELNYEREYPRRYHLHHLEKQDLKDLVGKCDEFDVKCMPTGRVRGDVAIGWYITVFRLRPEDTIGEIQYDRKLSIQSPRQTVSFCGIVRDGETSLLKMLRSVEPVVDEILIGVDEETRDRTRDVIQNFEVDVRLRHRSPRLRIEYFDVESPTKIGFDAARNEVLGRAECDWILWCDSDEELVEQGRLEKYLRQNGWRGYALAQHHFSVEPTTVLNTDYPVRLFRRDPDVRFLGVVHEHPENIHYLNDGVRFAWLIPGIHVAHFGYSTEVIRRARFRRNIGLIARDRKENPDRLLGKFLWIRDLALMNQFELEMNGGVVTPEMRARAQMGLDLWEETITEHADHPQVQRMIADHLGFYDTLVGCTGQGFTFRMKLASGLNGSAPQLSQVPELSSRFLNKRHLDKFLSVIVDREVEHYEDKYL